MKMARLVGHTANTAGALYLKGEPMAGQELFYQFASSL